MPRRPAARRSADVRMPPRSTRWNQAMTDGSIDRAKRLREAAVDGDAETVRRLLAMGVSPETGQGWDNALNRAISSGQLDCRAPSSRRERIRTRPMLGNELHCGTRSGRTTPALSRRCSMPVPTPMRGTTMRTFCATPWPEGAAATSRCCSPRVQTPTRCWPADLDQGTPTKHCSASPPRPETWASCSAWSRPVPIRAPMTARLWCTPHAEIMIPACHIF